MPYSASWVGGYKNEFLVALIAELKYKSVRALVWPLAEILSTAVPCLDSDVVVVPVPTIARHVQERGLDHSYLIAKKFSGLKGLRCERVVRKVGNAVQVGSDAQTRREQAETAYEVVGRVEGRRFLVVDDVYTTGASIEAVCRLLRQNGASDVMVAVVVKA